MKGPADLVRGLSLFTSYKTINNALNLSQVDTQIYQYLKSLIWIFLDSYCVKNLFLSKIWTQLQAKSLLIS
jgi:hypothetical protein